jgi:hypothetical protein
MAWTAARKRRDGSAILSMQSAMTLAASITFQRVSQHILDVSRIQEFEPAELHERNVAAGEFHFEE